MMMKNVSGQVAASLLALSVVLGAACGLGVGPARAAATHQGATPASKQHPIKLAAKALLAEFEKAPDATVKKYKGATLEVTGVVNRARANILGEPEVRLGVDTEFAMHLVVCQFSKQPKGLLDKMKVGETHTIVGRCEGSDSQMVNLAECRLVK